MKRVIWFFLLLLLPLTTYAGTVTVFSETFANNNTFAVNGYTYSNGACGSLSNSPNPLPSPFGSYAFAHDGLSTCGFSFGRNIKQGLAVNMSEGNIQLTFDFQINNDSARTNDPFTVDLTEVNNGDHKVSIIIAENAAKVQCDGTYIRCTACNQVLPITDYPYSAKATFQVNYDSSAYNLYINSTPVCSGVYFNTTTMRRFGFKGIRMASTLDANEFLSAFLDNLLIEYDTNISTYVGVGAPCTKDTDCITGRCYLGQCVQKQGNEACVHDYECVSGSCINGLCAKASLGQSLTAAKDELFGADSATSNLVAIIIMTMISVTVIFFGKGSAGSAIVAAGLFVVLSFFFAFLGWLSVWIVLGEIVVMGVIFVILYMAGTGTG